MPHNISLATAVRSDTAADYAAPHTASPPPETLLARIERAGPAALEDHELLGLLGIDIDIATLAPAGACASSATTPTTCCRPFSCRPSNGPGCTRCTNSTPGGWKRGFAATAGRLLRRHTLAAMSRRAFAVIATRSSPASSSINVTGSPHLKSSSGARWTPKRAAWSTSTASCRAGGELYTWGRSRNVIGLTVALEL